MGAAFNGGGWGFGAVLRDIYDALTGGSLLTGFNPYDGSLFGGLRAHQDRAVFERLHDYPGPSTAYDPESYGYENDVGNVGSITHVADAGALRLAVNAGTAASPSEGMEIDTAATALNGGTTVWRTGQGQNVSQTYSLDKIFHILDRKIRRQAFTGTSDVLTFAVQREGAANFDPRVTLVTEELR